MTQLLLAAQIGDMDWITALLSVKELFAIFFGSLLGSFKAQSLSPNKKVAIKINNIAMGVFAGCALAYHYLGSFHVWGAAIIAMTASSLCVALIDSLFRIAPEIAEKLVEKWFNVQLPDKGDDATPAPDSSDATPTVVSSSVPKPSNNVNEPITTPISSSEENQEAQQGPGASSN